MSELDISKLSILPAAKKREKIEEYEKQMKMKRREAIIQKIEQMSNDNVTNPYHLCDVTYLFTPDESVKIIKLFVESGYSVLLTTNMFFIEVPGPGHPREAGVYVQNGAELPDVLDKLMADGFIINNM